MTVWRGHWRRRYRTPRRRAGRGWRPASAALILLPALLLALLLDAPPARAGGTSWGPAADWSLTGRVRTELAGAINRTLTPGERASGMTVRLDAGLTLAAVTKRGSFAVDAGLARVIFLGADSPGSDDAERLDPRLSARASWRGKTYTLSGTAGFDLQPTSFTQADDTGIVNDETAQLTVDLSASLALRLDPRNRLTIGASGKLIDFTSSSAGLTPTRTVGLTLAWAHTLSLTTDAVFDIGLRDFTADNALATRSQTFDIGASLNRRQTPRHTFGFDAGLTLVRSTSTGGTDLDIGATGGGRFDYRLADLDIGLNISNSVDPSSTGSLQNFTRAGASLSHRVNSRERLGLSLDYTRRTPLGGAGETLQALSAGPSYTLSLTRETTLSLGYRFRANQSDLSGNAIGHRLLLTISHDLTFWP